VSELDPVIHQPVRLRILSALTALRHGDKLDFVWLRDVLGVTDGNLGSHLLKLEEAGYIDVEKTFVSRKPRTLVRASDKGRAAFQSHVKALKAIIGED